MTGKKFAIFNLLLLLSFGGCNSVENVTPASNSSNEGGTQFDNTLSVNIGGGSLCNDIDTPCVSVTVCAPNGGSCQTIPDVLLDTGSFGLRIFSQALSNMGSLEQVYDPSSANPLAECSQFGSMNAWGPVMDAQIAVGGETGVEAPMQVIESTYSTIPAAAPCSSSAATDPGSSGFNGILGVGPEPIDCRPCELGTGYHYYYECSGGSCTETTVQYTHQVTNPVALFAQDGNGLALTLPALSGDVSDSVTGTMTFGIGTQSNNVPGGSVQVYAVDEYDEISTTFTDTTDFDATYNSSFIDSGSNYLNFQVPAGSGLTTTSCVTYPGFFCVSPTTTYTATFQGLNYAGTAGSGPTANVSFPVGDPDAILFPSDWAYDNLAYNNAVFANAFDWGLPFFFGKTIYVGIDGTTATINGTATTGPYWAF